MSTRPRAAFASMATILSLAFDSAARAQAPLVIDEYPSVAKLLSAEHAGASGTALLAGGSDACATPDPISGSGPFPFDNGSATTGTDGQAAGNCLFYGQNGIPLDVWFAWTASQTSRVLLSTCGLTSVDTKVAVYLGSTCPGPAPSAIACNDDITSSGVGNLASFLAFDAVVGNTYLVQIGIYPLAAGGGVGAFTIDPIPDATCVYDDGSTDYASAVGTQGTLRTTGWIYSMGQVGQATRVTSVSSAWGWTATGTPLAAGLTGEVGVWEDPNDDGDPSDAILMGTAQAPMVGQHTDAFQAIALPAPVDLQGGFFVGAWVTHTTGFPIPRDISGCESRPGVGWLVGNANAPLDAVTLSANSTPPFRAPNGQTYVYLLRADCQPAPTGTVFCTGDGVAPHAACPCLNQSLPADQVGCLNSFGVGGRLRATGSAQLSADSLMLLADNLPASSTLFFQGLSQQAGGNGSTFGDGLRCATGSVVRLKTYLAQGSPGAASSTYPQAGDPSVSVRGAVTVPGTRTYQAWYRNSAAFCSASTFNLSNGLEVGWSP